MERLPESLRRRMEELERQDPLERVCEILGGFLADADSLDDVEADFKRIALTSTRGLARDLHAFEVVLSRPLDPGVPRHLVAWEANWVLDEPTDEKSLEFLHGIADMLRRVLASAGKPANPSDTKTDNPE